MNPDDDNFDDYNSEDWPDQDDRDFGPQMPDGRQQALLVKARLTVRQSDDHRQLFLSFKNSHGSVRDWRDLDAENGIGRDIARKDLDKLGWQKEKPREERTLTGIGAWLESGALDGKMVCEIFVRTRPGDTRDFTDVFLNGVVGEVEDPSLFDVTATEHFVPAAGAVPDDDIPF